MRSNSLDHAVVAAYFIGFVVSLVRFGWRYPRAFSQMLQDPERFARAPVEVPQENPGAAEPVVPAAAPIAAE